MEDSKNIENIDNKIKELKMEKKKIKQAKDRNLRLRSNNRGKSNVNQRVSINFNKKLDSINTKREENGLECLSYPKITELIIKHKKCWKPIQNDIIHYNTGLDIDEGGAEFNDK
jgi:hypothetical protein